MLHNYQNERHQKQIKNMRYVCAGRPRWTGKRRGWRSPRGIRTRSGSCKTIPVSSPGLAFRRLLPPPRNPSSSDRCTKASMMFCPPWNAWRPCFPAKYPEHTPPSSPTHARMPSWDWRMAVSDVRVDGTDKWSCSEDYPLSMSDFNRREAQGAFFFTFGVGLGGGGVGDERAQKKQQRAHARNRKICSTLHNHKSRRTVTITNRFIAAIERKLLQTEFAANVAGLTFFTCIRLTFKGEVATSMVLLYTNSTMVLYTQIAKKFAANVAGLTFFTCIRLTFKGEVATSMVLLYTNSTMVLYTQIAKKLTPSILHSHMPFFSFFFSF